MLEAYKLIRDLSSKDEYVRLSAARTLGNEKVVDAMEPLTSLLSDPNVAVRTIAAEALGKIGDERAANSLIACLNDDYSRMRKAAAEALGKFADYRALTPVIHLSQTDNDPEVRAVARKTVDKINSVVQEIIDKLDDELSSPRESDRKQAVKFLGRIGNIQAVTILLKALNDRSWDVQNMASEEIDKLMVLGIEPFLKGLKDNSWQVRVSSADYLGRIKNLAAVEDLLGALEDSKIEVVRASAKALGEIKDKRALRPFNKILQNCDNKTKEIIITAISKTGGTGAFELMIGMLRKNKDFSRDISEEKLSEMGNDVLLPLMFTLEENKDDVKFQDTVIRILNKTGDKGIKYFQEQLSNYDKRIRKLSIQALGYMRATEALEAIEAFTKDEDEQIKDTALTAIKMLHKKKKRTLKPNYIFSGSIIDRVSTFFTSTIKMFHNVRKTPREDETFICGKCGKMISRKASTDMLGKIEVMRFGMCPQCNRIICNNCAMTVLIGDGETSISCPKCSIELREV
ncbi:MAG: HEAT repeat domain-containing protein [Candidatus Eremiobacterota bacterium]